MYSAFVQATTDHTFIDCESNRQRSLAFLNELHLLHFHLSLPTSAFHFQLQLTASTDSFWKNQATYIVKDDKHSFLPLTYIYCHSLPPLPVCLPAI